MDGDELCDRCADRRVAAHTGFPELPPPPAPITFAGPDGERHVLAFRLWRAPTGIEVELHETGVPEGEGYSFAVLGAHDADITVLVDHVRSRALAEISRLQLEPNPHREGWLVRGDEVTGRLEWNSERGVGGPYNAVVDGRTLTWDELGRALEPFEGFRFRIVIEDPCDDLRPHAAIIPIAEVTSSTTPGTAPRG